jgi:hypothetical protein
MVYEMTIVAVPLILGSDDIVAPVLLIRLAMIDARWLDGAQCFTL